MATTVRRVKQENRLRRQNQIIQDEDNPCKSASPIPPPPPSKPPPSDTELEQQSRPKQYQYQQVQQQQQQQQQQQEGSQGTFAVAETCVWMKQRTPNNKDAFAPDYRMPPLYGDEQTTHQQLQQQSASLQTHSSKFPIEREVVLSLGEKNSKIPILHEYKQKTSGKVAIAPDAPIKQQAWVHEATQMQELKLDARGKSFQTSENYSASSGVSTSKSIKLDEEKTKSLSRTYHTIKDMISSRFGPNRKDVDPESEASLNNVTEDLRKSSRSINEGETKRQDSSYATSRNQDLSISMQQYSKNSYGQYGPSYNYQGSQQNVPLPGQLQSSNQHQPALPSGQGAQLHVTHHTPPGGIQTVHQTQIAPFAQSTTAVQNSNRDYIVQSPGGMINQVIHQTPLQAPNHNQNQVTMQIKQSMQQSQQTSGMIQNSGPNCQSTQQLIHQNQHHLNPRLAQQHTQNMHQRQLIQQIQQQQQQNSVGLPNPQNALRNQHPHFNNGNGPAINYQHYQQNRQSMSRSQIDLPSTSRQLTQDLRIPSQEVYYHYNQNRTNRFGTPQIYSRNDNVTHQDNEFQRRNSGKGIEKALSQPQLSYDEGKTDNNCAEGTNPTLVNRTSEYVDNKEKYEISVEEPQIDHFSRNSSRRTTAEDSRPATSFGIRTEETRSSQKDYQRDRAPDGQESIGISIQKRIEELRKKSEIEICQDPRMTHKNVAKIDAQKWDEKSQTVDNIKKSSMGMEESNATKREPVSSYNSNNKESGISQRKDGLEHGIGKLKIQHQGSGSDYDKTGQSSSNVDSGRGSAVYSSGRRLPAEDSNHGQVQDAEWVDIVESELRSILEPKDTTPVMHSTFSESVSSVTPPLPPLTPQESPRTSRKRFSTSLPYGIKPNYEEYVKGSEKRNYPSSIKHRGVLSPKKESTKKFSHLFGFEAGELTSTTTALDLDSMLDRSDSDLSTNDARTIRKQLEGLENMYSEVLKLLGGSTKKRRRARGLASYGSVSSLPTSSVSSRPIIRHHDKRRSHNVEDRMKKVKDIKSINKRFQRLESHVVTLARSVAHLSSEMRTQHLMIQEMENIRGEIAALRTQTNMAMVRSQSQPVIKDSELPALSNPSRVKKLTKFFGTEPPLIRLFLRELGYEKYANAFEKERVGMVELPYLSEDRLQKMGVPLGPRLRILQEARISVCKDPVYVV